MKRPLIFFAVSLSFIALIGYLYADAGVLFGNKKSGLKDYGPAPTFALLSHTGEEFSTAELSGKIWTLNFFFTSCPDVCPILVANVRTVHDLYPLGDEPISVALSVDPKNDTPEAMRKFGEELGLNMNRWRLLQGPIETIRSISQDQLKASLGPEASMHSNRVFLIDRNGRIRGSYLALMPNEIERMKREIRRLAREK